MKFVDEAKHCWRWLSMQIPAANTAFLATWALLPSKFQDALPVPWVVGIAVGLLILGMLGRVVDQTPKGKPNDPA